MGIIQIEVAKRHNKHEDTANIRRVSTGYKMSTMAKNTLGINPVGSACLNVALDEATQKLIIKCVSVDTEHNAKLNTQRIISSTGIVKYLERIGDQFEISSETNEDGYHFMNDINITQEGEEQEKMISTQTKEEEEETTVAPEQPTRSVSLRTDDDDVEEEVNFGR